MSKRQPQGLDNSLSILFNELGIERKIKKYRAMTEWPEIVGDRISKVATPEKITENILYIKVKNSSWRNELIFMKHEILKKIDKAIGGGIIQDIKFI